MMKKLALAALALSIALLPAAPAHAYWGHGGPRYGFSFGYYGGGYPGYYGPAYYPAYPAPYYYAPTYYAPPPTVVYSQPAQVVYATPSTSVVQTSPQPAPSLLANQASPDFTGPNGQQCRQYQAATGNGTACLQPDGSWRIVQ